MESELIDNIMTFAKSAELVYKARDYTSATVLYFKALFVILDLIIYRKIGRTPKDHTERFRILQENMYDLYKLVDKYFQIYRDSYSRTIEKWSCDEVKKNVERLIKETGISI